MVAEENNVTIEDVKDHLCVIKTADGDEYLGIINCEMSSDKNLIEYAREIGEAFSRSDIRSWMKDFNMGELATFKLQMVGYKTSPLTLDEQQWVDEVWFNMNKARVYVQQYMQNLMLDRLEDGGKSG